MKYLTLYNLFKSDSDDNSDDNIEEHMGIIKDTLQEIRDEHPYYTIEVRNRDNYWVPQNIRKNRQEKKLHTQITVSIVADSDHPSNNSQYLEVYKEINILLKKLLSLGYKIREDSMNGSPITKRFVFYIDCSESLSI